MKTKPTLVWEGVRTSAYFPGPLKIIRVRVLITYHEIDPLQPHLIMEWCDTDGMGGDRWTNLDYCRLDAQGSWARGILASAVEQLMISSR